MWNLSSRKKINFIEFKGQKFVNIREYYEKDGEVLPGKKGICLKEEEFETVKQILSKVDKIEIK